MLNIFHQRVSMQRDQNSNGDSSKRTKNQKFHSLFLENKSGKTLNSHKQTMLGHIITSSCILVLCLIIFPKKHHSLFESQENYGSK